MAVSINFKTAEKDEIYEKFEWLNCPQQYSFHPERGLSVFPNQTTDFWCKTYHSPPVKSCTGHALLYKVPPSSELWECTLEFSLSPTIQYDQAGLLVFVDDDHWLKAGIEVEDGASRMSCVVTNVHSDWNYLKWSRSDSNVEIRAIVKRFETVWECKVEYRIDGEWVFLREAPIIIPAQGVPVAVGPMCCSPKKEGNEGMDATFHNIIIKF